jgi:[ribosomal protein S18]-alanine N-acetyltransferase
MLDPYAVPIREHIAAPLRRHGLTPRGSARKQSSAMFSRRHTMNPADATPRPTALEDHGALARLLANARRHYLAVGSEELPALLAEEPGVALARGDALWAAAVGERIAAQVAWLRALALADGLPPDSGLDALMRAYHDQLRAAGVAQSYYSGSDLSDGWLRAALLGRGYTRHTEVVVYEKIRLDTPVAGSTAVTLRRATPADLATILALDKACFDVQWHKDRRALGPALVSAPCFLLAELDGAPVGYAFATSHYGGRLVHLVRIAVLPAMQGQGIGARLLAEVVGHARGSCADIVTLNTQADNTPSQRLYERFGFRRTGERQTILVLQL